MMPPERNSSTAPTPDDEYADLFQEIDEYVDQEAEGPANSSERTRVDEA